MKRSTRHILLIVLSIFIVIGGLGIYGVYRLVSFLNSVGQPVEVPAELKETRVLLGEGFLKKKEIFKLDREGTFTTIGKSSGIEDEKERQQYVQTQTAKNFYGFDDIKVIGYEIVAVGKFGAYIFDINGELKREAHFEPATEKLKLGPYEHESYQLQVDNLRIVPLDKTGYGFLSWGSVDGLRIFNDHGREIWAHGKTDIDTSVLLKDEKEREADYEKSVYVMEGAVGDLDGDGISEYIVAKKKDGIRVFDRSGNEKWFQPDDYPANRLEVRDLDGDGKNELIEIGKQVRNGDGSLLRNLKGSGELPIFAADKNKKTVVIQSCGLYKLRLTCVDEDNKTILESDAPLSDIKLENPRSIQAPPGTGIAPVTMDSVSAYHLDAGWVRLKKDKPAHLALVASFTGLPRANLYIYAPDGTLVYHELLPEAAETLTVAPGADGVEELLVAGKDTIWKYGG